jgi:hypothetical protein
MIRLASMRASGPFGADRVRQPSPALSKLDPFYRPKCTDPRFLSCRGGFQTRPTRRGPQAGFETRPDKTSKRGPDPIQAILEQRPRRIYGLDDAWAIGSEARKVRP